MKILLCIFWLITTPLWAQKAIPVDSVQHVVPVLVVTDSTGVSATAKMRADSVRALGLLDTSVASAARDTLMVPSLAGSLDVADSVMLAKKGVVLGHRDTALMAGNEEVLGDSVKAEGIGGQAKKKLTETADKVGNIFSFGNVFVALFILVSTYISIRILTWLITLMANRFGQYRLKLMMLVPIVRILLWTGALYVVIVGIFSPSADALLAFGASAGIAVGFAAQDVLKNIFGGILIILDRPFQVGDKIQVGSFYGEVVSIGLRTVRIVTPDDSLVSIPNAELVNQSVSNSNSGALDCQVVVEFHLPPDVDIGLVKKLAYEAAATSKYVFLDKPIVVMVGDVYNMGFLTKLKVKAYVLDTRYEFAFASDVTERAKAAFVDAGIYAHLPNRISKPQ